MMLLNSLDKGLEMWIWLALTCLVLRASYHSPSHEKVSEERHQEQQRNQEDNWHGNSEAQGKAPSQDDVARAFSQGEPYYQFEDDGPMWQNVHEPWVTAIDAEVQKEETHFELHARTSKNSKYKTKYKLSLDAMTQTNLTTWTTRNLRRVAFSVPEGE